MSTAARLVSGSMASWAQIAVTIIAQVVLVPIYLSHWSVKTYGIWLAIQGITSALSMLDMGYQSYIGYEFLRLGKKNLPLLSKSLWSAMLVGTMIGLLQILLMTVFIFTPALTFLLGESGSSDHELIHAAGVSLILQGVTWLVIMTIPGLMVRALAAFGYFPRTAWWGFTYAIVTTVSPIGAVLFGGDLLMASIVLFVCSMLCGLGLYLDLLQLLKREKIKLLKPSLDIGFTNLRLSLPLLGKSILENVRQQGVRLVLAPMAGATGLAAFSTMRTGANVALQGLNTIINPLAPDLMRFLHDRDQARSEAAFATIWVVVVALMAPGVIILQLIIEPFFVFWTQGKIPFDPLLFAVLSLGVLVYAVVQPAVAVVIGNNLTKTQLGLAAVAAVFVFTLLAVLVPTLGILGAGIALLIAEIVAAVGYRIYAKKWLVENQLRWPERPFYIAVRSVLIAAVSLSFLIWFPQFKWLIVSVSLVILLWNLWRYWQVLPLVAIESAKNLVRRIPVLKLWIS
jgi:O-antigen/teichoic acid export membrane protein